MSDRGGAALYTPAVLSLAIALADYPLSPELQLRGSAVSRVCGSRIEFGCLMAPDGTLAQVGARVSACAIGQAAAAVFLQNAVGRNLAQIGMADEAIEAWLKEKGARPDWPGLVEIEPARAYPGRHAAILLPWRAATDALCKAESAG